MKKILLLILLIGSVTGIYYVSHTKLEAQDLSGDEHPADQNQEPEEQKPNIQTEEYTIGDGDTFTVAMEALGIDYSDALKIVETAEPIFDFTKVKLGKTIKLISEDGVRKRLEYEPNTDQLFVVDLQNNFQTTEQEIPYDISVVTDKITITKSMYVDWLNANLPEMAVIKFADVFAWEVDFSVQVQPGDTLKVMYEKRTRDGIPAGVGNIIKGEFVNSGEHYFAYRYVDANGKVSYYTENGGSLVKQFLKAPLSFTRITSGYTDSRFHPTLERTMPHRAIDYAAPIGTPIMAVADGTVTFAKWNGCFGNNIDLKHNSVYETQYAHLSKFSVVAGQTVHQGDIIGYTGTTGCSTGPHLHYQVRVNGTLVNPLEVDFPEGDPIPEDQMADFLKQKDEIDAQW
ncbi:hypothetical protein CO173_01655 [Candidatus Uhrbacteria bacterium CG_4_9_14_3_um_filter_41_35]|uniref:M23ase beta-sheet core domain-containing protein n=1 Tax=Candidatus Uhrbacteria bacterium CG_4_9_14_3_um_filter_41_35 TaxID=1975034 RepID=A0A2M7XF02_9BACT|nr:MAG: hypothetical protein COV92_03260 [Candidatus Uhrbacteria bacterium CG11_big_fil_rev_8_21_14_0_20_41_9]PJA46451.1 MAG: hypothetical protein CO173_01655 [Candidatus Uhrbacteria bacterium CG_4_9_14_3_um_filter_41_35]